MHVRRYRAACPQAHEPAAGCAIDVSNITAASTRLPCTEKSARVTTAGIAAPHVAAAAGTNDSTHTSPTPTTQPYTA